jgi:hypothetical protein
LERAGEAKRVRPYREAVISRWPAIVDSIDYDPYSVEYALTLKDRRLTYSDWVIQATDRDYS